MYVFLKGCVVGEDNKNASSRLAAVLKNNWIKPALQNGEITAQIFITLKWVGKQVCC